MTHGILRLSPQVYDLFQVDVDGAALQAVGFSTLPGRRIPSAAARRRLT